MYSFGSGMVRVSVCAVVEQKKKGKLKSECANRRNGCRKGSRVTVATFVIRPDYAEYTYTLCETRQQGI